MSPWETRTRCKSPSISGLCETHLWLEDNLFSVRTCSEKNVTGHVILHNAGRTSTAANRIWEFRDRLCAWGKFVGIIISHKPLSGSFWERGLKGRWTWEASPLLYRTTAEGRINRAQLVKTAFIQNQPWRQPFCPIPATRAVAREACQTAGQFYPVRKSGP